MKKIKIGKVLFITENAVCICNKYTGTVKFNVIPREGNMAINIRSYKYKWHKNMIRNGMWNFSLFQTLVMKRIIGIFFLIIPDLIWVM